jgi:hypothetical protein
VFAGWVVFTGRVAWEPAHRLAASAPSFVFFSDVESPLSEEMAMEAARQALVRAGLEAKLWDPVDRTTPYPPDLATVVGSAEATEKFLERPIPTDPNYGAIRFQHEGAMRRVTLHLEAPWLTCTVYRIEATEPNPPRQATAASRL